MTILGRLTSLTHLDGAMVAEEEASYAVLMAAGSKINQVKILQITIRNAHSLNIYLYSSGRTVIKLELLTCCSQASLLAHSSTNSGRPRSLSLLSTAQLLCPLSPPPLSLSRELELDWTAKVSYRLVGFSQKVRFQKVQCKLYQNVSSRMDDVNYVP